MIKPHQRKYKKKITGLVRFEAHQMNNYKVLNNTISSAMSIFEPLKAMPEFVSHTIQLRKSAKRAYLITCHRLAVSMHIASTCTYVKARNRNKKLKRKS